MACAVVLDRSFLQDHPEGRRAKPDGLTPCSGSVPFQIRKACKKYKGKLFLARQFLLRPAAMPTLTDGEKAALQRSGLCVSVHGRDWDAIAATGALGARNASAIRWAWDALSSHGITAAKIVVEEPELAPLVVGPVTAVARLPEALGRQAAHRIHSGRPWNYIVRRGGERQAPREPTALQKK